MKTILSNEKAQSVQQDMIVHASEIFSGSPTRAPKL